ncbi:MAG: hypothetical protein HY777_00715 [Betaproteobacteria bacterium]|nr:hypothetical protein [Betaproteobacteria bacterium]
MKNLASKPQPMSLVIAAASAPILFAFVLGSLPVLLPVMVVRWFGRGKPQPA